MKIKEKGTFSELGKYNQDKINGFEKEDLLTFINSMKLRPGQTILDFMCGNGNLITTIKNFSPDITSSITWYGIDIASIQINHGKEEFSTENVTLYEGDVRKKLPFREESIDTVVRKSASHELKLSDHLSAMKQAYEVLKKDGSFVEMGFLFEDALESEEFLLITNKKDALAGLDFLVQNRTFLTRESYNSLMKNSGFQQVFFVKPITYRLSMNEAAKVYFKNDTEKIREFNEYCMDNSRILQKHHRVEIEEERIKRLIIPGYITRCEK